MIWEAYAIGVEAALERGDEAATAWLGALVDGLPPVQATPLLRAGRSRLAAEQAHRRGDLAEADGHDRRAIDLLRSLDARPLLARGCSSAPAGARIPRPSPRRAPSTPSWARPAGWPGSTSAEKSRHSTLGAEVAQAEAVL